MARSTPTRISNYLIAAAAFLALAVAGVSLLL